MPSALQLFTIVYFKGAHRCLARSSCWRSPGFWIYRMLGGFEWGGGVRGLEGGRSDNGVQSGGRERSGPQKGPTPYMER